MFLFNFFFFYPGGRKFLLSNGDGGGSTYMLNYSIHIKNRVEAIFLVFELSVLSSGTIIFNSECFGVVRTCSPIQLRLGTVWK